MSAALAFGLYHFAHSPPFNTLPMVSLLSAVGVATGIFFFLGGDLYSTIVLHNAFAMRGVIQVLDESGISIDTPACSCPYLRRPLRPSWSWSSPTSC